MHIEDLQKIMLFHFKILVFKCKIGQGKIMTQRLIL